MANVLHVNPSRSNPGNIVLYYFVYVNFAIYTWIESRSERWHDESRQRSLFDLFGIISKCGISFSC